MKLRTVLAILLCLLLLLCSLSSCTLGKKTEPAAVDAENTVSSGSAENTGAAEQTGAELPQNAKRNTRTCSSGPDTGPYFLLK